MIEPAPNLAPDELHPTQTPEERWTDVLSAHPVDEEYAKSHQRVRFTRVEFTPQGLARLEDVVDFRKDELGIYSTGPLMFSEHSNVEGKRKWIIAAEKILEDVRSGRTQEIAAKQSARLPNRLRKLARQTLLLGRTSK